MKSGPAGGKIISALFLGCAIPVMHYTGMWAATFHPSAIVPDLTHAIGVSTIGIVSISAISFFLLRPGMK
ncbi:MAG: MHYT domain-containing protein [Candidatus Sulfotelmatobacter sp.]